MLSTWPVHALDELAKVARLRGYKREQQVLANDPQRRDIYIVASGSVAVDSIDESGSRFLLTIFGPGEALGWIRLLEDTRFVYHYQAREATVLVQIPVDVMRCVLDAHPLLWRHLCLEMLRRSHQQILAQRRQTFRHFERRLVDAVLQTARTVERRGQDGAHLSVRLSQSELAAMLSVSRQTVNKQLQRLQARGLLHAEYGRLVIRDQPGLERIARDETDSPSEP